MASIKFPPPEPEFIKARYHGGAQTPKAIVIHGTVSADDAGTARNIARWWAGPNSPVTSCHYTVDPVEVIQSVGDHVVAYHSGYNKNTIGIELCDEQAGPASRWLDKDSKAILARAARLVAELCLAYDIKAERPTVAELKKKGPHGVYGHNDSRLAFGYTTHTDPRDFDWDGFLHDVQTEIRKIRSEAADNQSGDTGRWRDRMKPEEYFLGARGRHVTWLAKRLVAHGYGKFYSNGVDKTFSKGEDMAAVRAFQRAQGWTGADADGLPGPITLKLLSEKPSKPVPPPVTPPTPEVDPDVPPVPKPEPKPDPKPDTGGEVTQSAAPTMGQLVMYAAQVGSVPGESEASHIEKVFQQAEARGVAWIIGNGPAGGTAARLREFGRRYGYRAFIPSAPDAPWFAARDDVVQEAEVSQ